MVEHKKIDRKEALRRARQRKIVEVVNDGNRTAKATLQRQKNADRFARTMELLLYEMKLEGFDEKAKVVKELNERGCLTSGGTQWSIQKLNRLLKRIKLICHKNGMRFELEYVPCYDYSAETLARRMECERCRKDNLKIDREDCTKCWEKYREQLHRMRRNGPSE